MVLIIEPGPNLRLGHPNKTSGCSRLGTNNSTQEYIIFIIAAEVFELHMEELRAKQEEISKKNSDIKLLEAIIQTLSGKESTSVHY